MSASLIALLQAALSLLTLVQSTPNIPQSLQTSAIQIAEQALSLVTSQVAPAPVRPTPASDESSTSIEAVTIDPTSLTAASSSFSIFGQLGSSTSTVFQVLLVPTDSDGTNVRTSVIQSLRQCACGGLSDSLLAPQNGWITYFNNIARGQYTVYVYSIGSDRPVATGSLAVDY